MAKFSFIHCFHKHTHFRHFTWHWEYKDGWDVVSASGSLDHHHVWEIQTPNPVSVFQEEFPGIHDLQANDSKLEKEGGAFPAAEAACVKGTGSTWVCLGRSVRQQVTKGTMLWRAVPATLRSLDFCPESHGKPVLSIKRISSIHNSVLKVQGGQVIRISEDGCVRAAWAELGQQLVGRNRNTILVSTTK